MVSEPDAMHSRSGLLCLSSNAQRDSGCLLEEKTKRPDGTFFQNKRVRRVRTKLKKRSKAIRMRKQNDSVDEKE